jgi:general nucleoside transport system ATP-binding protein
VLDFLVKAFSNDTMTTTENRSIMGMSGESASAPMLEVRGIVKSFGTLLANENINLSVEEGEIHALLGENGAGKSTLVKMLYGSLEPDAGTVLWRGKPVAINSPFAARAIGIGMVFQHFSLFESLSVADNILLSLGRNYSRRNINQRARQLSVEYGLPLNPRSIIGDLSVGERQRVEIVRCLLQKPDLIILDEPTSVLTPQEADNLFVTLERLRSEGKSILYISHRLEEVQRLCDRATILRHGKVVDSCDPRQETASSLASKMVGSDVAAISRKGRRAGDSEILLEMNDVNLPAATPFAVSLKHISFKLRAGEILGIAGVAGNGQSELFQTVSGETSVRKTESIRFRDKAVGKMGINQRRCLGAAFVPEERLGHGAVPELNLAENLLLSRHASDRVAFLRFGIASLIRYDIVLEAMNRVVWFMDVRKSGENPDASSLSGGNLQKFIMGRELDRQPSLLVVNQPSWGVDAGAAAGIRQALIDLANSGSAVMVISQDLDEIFEISDRIAVMHDGGLSEPISIDDATYEKVGLLMGGANPGHELPEMPDIAHGGHG